MPNHVRNTVTFNGSVDNLTTLKIILKELSLFQMLLKENDSDEFNFYAIKSPDLSIIDEYYKEPEYKDFAERLSNSYNFWYDWNNREWGTKWNAYHVDYYNNLEDDKAKVYYLTYCFDTAWSPPEGIINALPKFLKDNNLDVNFVWHFEEEQGWGGIVEGDTEDTTITEQWDIPSSHADYVARDNTDNCICNWAEETEDWFEDCPRPEQEEESKE
jgi:hypothetical protein